MWVTVNRNNIIQQTGFLSVYYVNCSIQTCFGSRVVMGNVIQDLWSKNFLCKEPNSFFELLFTAWFIGVMRQTFIHWWIVICLKNKLCVIDEHIDEHIDEFIYGGETWSMTVTNNKKLAAAHHKWLRRILGITWKQRIIN